MNSTEPQKIVTTQALQKGQIWQVEDSNVRIGNVGKTLVEYKVVKDHINRGTLHLMSKHALQDYLNINNAVLLQ